MNGSSTSWANALQATLSSVSSTRNRTTEMLRSIPESACDESDDAGLCDIPDLVDDGEDE